MTLDKAIKYGKEKRKPKRPVSSGCLNHGWCEYCRGNRLYASTKGIQKARYDEKALLSEES